MDGKSSEYNILVIIADGQVTSQKETVHAIRKASNYPLSIVVVGVGVGPWGQMEKFDDKIKRRQFDNFQFVDYEKCKRKAFSCGMNTDVVFALNALMEIPNQFKAIKKLNLLGRPTENVEFKEDSDESDDCFD